MQKLIFLILGVYLSFVVNAQHHHCGTLDHKTKWLTQFQQRLEKGLVQKNLNEPLNVPMTIHLLGSNDGRGYLTMPTLLDALCTLNEDFEQWNIQFFIQDILYVANERWDNHTTFAIGREMVNANQVPNTLNIFFVSNAAGACGYANIDSYYSVISKSCTGRGDHTWAHEIGHALSLNHTFYGWEAIGDRDATTYNFNEPAPEKIVYLGEEVIVERVDGTNCRVAADGFCDTEPDYLFNRWACNNNTRSRQLQKDPTGVSFNSDGSLIMSYAFDACTNRFSEEQALAMRANLMEQKNGLGRRAMPFSRIEQTTILPLSPLDSGLVNAENGFLEWEAVENATHYIVQVSRLPSFPVFDVNQVVTTNRIELPNLQLGRRYFWRVRPFNYYSSCAPVSPRFTFTATVSTSTKDLSSFGGVHIAPTLVSNGEAIHIQFAQPSQEKVEVRLIDLMGKVIRSQQYNTAYDLAYNTQGSAAGLYLLQIIVGKEQVVKKIVIQ
jgi:hypothetical protein